jgi:hypothetical protein
MFHILAHTYLPHHTILVPIDTSKLSQVRIHVLKTVIKLERVHVTETVLDVAVNHELDNAEDFTAKMEGVTETRFLALLCGQCFNGFKVEVIIQMQVVEVLAMNQQHQHVESLTAYLQSHLDPIHLCELEKLCACEGFE